jgi:hypothetical protein
MKEQHVALSLRHCARSRKFLRARNLQLYEKAIEKNAVDFIMLQPFILPELRKNSAAFCNF